jgi:trk system potassium uptake protein TrkA
MQGEFMVIGLGRFGRAVALQLSRQGQSVLAVDANPERVQALASEVSAAVCADTTDEATLIELHPEHLSCAVVAIGDQSVQGSILTTALLRQAGVPHIVARAVDELHGRVLRAVGAHDVVNPEKEIGLRLARRLLQPGVFEQIELGDEADLAEVAVPEIFVGKTLIELDLRRRHEVTAVAIQRQDKVRAALDGSERLESGDVLVVIGSREAIRRLATRA